jgi:hypothetical protein
VYEPVETVDDFYDGPRAGVATAFGRRCRYETLGWYTEGRDDDEVRFVLTFLDDHDPRVVIATASFRALPKQESTPPGEIRRLEAEWAAEGAT